MSGSGMIVLVYLDTVKTCSILTSNTPNRNVLKCLKKLSLEKFWKFRTLASLLHSFSGRQLGMRQCQPVRSTLNFLSGRSECTNMAYLLFLRVNKRLFPSLYNMKDLFWDFSKVSQRIDWIRNLSTPMETHFVKNSNEPWCMKLN
jgi:hypothetical protein